MQSFPDEYTDNEDSDQSARMNLVFIGYTCQKVRFLMLVRNVGKGFLHYKQAEGPDQHVLSSSRIWVFVVR